jgi:hypothetical protein
MIIAAGTLGDRKKTHPRQTKAYVAAQAMSILRIAARLPLATARPSCRPCTIL